MQYLRFFYNLKFQRKEAVKRFSIVRCSAIDTAHDRRFEFWERVVIPGVQHFLLDMSPQSFDQVEIRRVGREMDECNCELFSEFRDDSAFLITSIVQEQYNGFPRMLLC